MRNFISTSQRSYLWLSDHFRLDPDVSGSRFLFSCSTLNVKHVACRCCSCILKFPFPEKHSHFRNWNPPFKVIFRLISLHICWLSPSFVPFLADQTHKKHPKYWVDTFANRPDTKKHINGCTYVIWVKFDRVTLVMISYVFSTSFVSFSITFPVQVQASKAMLTPDLAWRDIPKKMNI